MCLANTLAELQEARGDAGSAIQHHKLAACAGIQPSLTALRKAFKNGLLAKEELEHCLRAFQASNNKMKSKDRDAFNVWKARMVMAGRLPGRHNQL